MIDLQDVSVGNPFPGLRPFETDEYHLFFGREGQSDELIKRLRVTRFLAVVGTSGSGKSSLIRAGLLPALHGGLMPGAGSSWRVALIRPGHDPIGNLAHELGAILNDDGDSDLEIQNTLIETTLRRSTLGLVDAVRQARMSPHDKLLVVVDQFEELFRFKEARKETDSEDDALGFVKLLIEASAQAEVPIYVVLTMRSDFLGDCSQFAGLPETINQGQYLIPRMSRDERRAAITGPVAVGGGEMTVPLINRLLNDVGDNPDQLPILQHALMRTWDYSLAHRHNGEAIGLEHYEAIGSMAEALSRHADEAFNELPSDRSRLIAEKIFKALTEQGAANRETRRPVPLHQLCSIADATEAEVVEVIETFRSEGRSFLMPPMGTTLKPDTIIDISHESLIRNWERLHEWVNEEARSAQIYRRLAEAAVLYHREEEGLLGGPFLQIALDWRKEQAPNRVWAYRYNPEFNTAERFLDASRDDRDAKRAAQERERQEQLDRESRELKQAAALAEKEKRLAEAEKQRAEEQATARQRELEQAQAFAEQQTRAASRLKRLTFALVLISLLALGAAGGAVYGLTVARSSERKTRALAGDLESSKRQVEASRLEVEASRLEVAKERKLAEASQALADEKELKAKAEEKKAEDAKADALKATQIAKDAQIAANATLVELSTETELSRLTREAQGDFQRGDMTSAEKTLNQLATTYATDENRSRLVAWAKSHLGETRRQLGKQDESIRDLEEAREIQEEAAINEPSLSREDAEKRTAEYVDTVTWLALAYSDKGRHEDAETLYIKAQNVRGSADTVESLARHYDNRSDSENAAKSYEEALTQRRADGSSPKLVALLTEVAVFYWKHQDPSTAVKLYEEALRNQESYLQPYDKKLADTFTGLSQVYDDVRRKGWAKSYNDLAREIRRSGLREHSNDGATMQRLAQRYVEVGKYRQAAMLEVRAQAIHENEQGAENRGPVNSLVSLGAFFRYAAKSAPEAPDRQAFYDRALATYQRALEISERKTYPIEQGRALDGLALLQLEHKKFAEAERYYKRVLEMREQKTTSQVFPGEEMIDNLQGLAAAVTGLGRYTEAEAYLLRSLKTFDGMTHYTMTMRGIDPPLLRLSLSARLAEIYHSQGRVKESDDLYRPMAGQLKKDVKNYGGDNVEDYLDIIEEAGQFFTDRGDTAAAESFYLLVWPQEIRPTVLTVPSWPEAYSKSLMATVPVTSSRSVIRILEAYAVLLAKTGRTRESDMISHGVQRMQERLMREGPPSLPSR